MELIIEKLLSAIDDGNYLVFVFVAVLAISINIKKIHSFYESLRRNKLEKIKESLSCEYITGLTREQLESEVETEYFKLITGMYAEKTLREKAIELHKKSNGELGFFHFIRARSYLLINNGALEVNISGFERFSYIFNHVSAAILGIGAAAFIFIPSYIKGISIYQILALAGFGVFLLIITLFLLNQTFPFYSANRIKNYIKKHTEQVSS